MTVSIRLAEKTDAAALTALLHELGYDVAVQHVRATLAAAQSHPVYVATNNETVVGLIALHIASWIQLEKPIVRITAMIVADKFQRRGIGRKLMDRALEHARERDCRTIELTTANDRDEAHAFYRDLGFEQTSIRFKRVLP